MKKLKVIVQGEVVIRQIEQLPEQLPQENKEGAVAYGETGGLHQLQGGNSLSMAQYVPLRNI